MQRLKSILFPEFATVRQLEMKGLGLFKWAGIIALAGVLIILFMPYIMPVGVVLVAAAVVILLIGMLWISWLGRHQSLHVFCPYCASKNDVFLQHREFSCDICDRLIHLDKNGEPIAAEGSVNHKVY